jgi:hypothetical protein
MAFLLVLVLCTTLPTYFMWSHTIYGNEKQSPKPIHDSVFKRFPRYFTNCHQSGVRDRVSRQTVIPFVWARLPSIHPLCSIIVSARPASNHDRFAASEAPAALPLHQALVPPSRFFCCQELARVWTGLYELVAYNRSWILATVVCAMTSFTVSAVGSGLLLS